MPAIDFLHGGWVLIYVKGIVAGLLTGVFGVVLCLVALILVARAKTHGPVGIDVNIVRSLYLWLLFLLFFSLGVVLQFRRASH